MPPAQQSPISSQQAVSEDASRSSKGLWDFGEVHVVVDVPHSSELIKLSSTEEVDPKEEEIELEEDHKP